jgi:DNA invertase Pin-like site-specific DNA recombinase
LLFDTRNSTKQQDIRRHIAITVTSRLAATILPVRTDMQSLAFAERPELQRMINDL